MSRKKDRTGNRILNREGRIVADVLDTLDEALKLGVSLKNLDRFLDKYTPVFGDVDGYRRYLFREGVVGYDFDRKLVIS